MHPYQGPFVVNYPIRYNDPDGHCGPLCVGGAVLVVALAVVDIGWTGYDAYQAAQVINDPNSSPEARKQAYDTIDLTVGAEIVEPDLGPVQLPLDDIVRHATGIGVLKPLEPLKKAVLGLDGNLDNFTRNIGGQNHKNWWWTDGGSLITSQDLSNATKEGGATSDFFEFAFPTAMNNADEIHFSLAGMSDNIVYLAHLSRPRIEKNKVDF